MALIKELKLRDFRNFEERTFSFDASDVVFTGKNGSGKSNILEAISYLSTLRSFRRAPVRDMVAIGKEQFFLNASIENRNRTQDISVIESISGARQLFINRNLCRQVSDFLFEYRCVCFSPGDFAIGSGASGVRRRFIDQLISSNDRNYLLGLSGYVRALTQRNRAAKAKNEMAMRAFEVVMAENAPGIIAAPGRPYSSLRPRYALFWRANMTFPYGTSRILTEEPKIFCAVFPPCAGAKYSGDARSPEFNSMI